MYLPGEPNRKESPRFRAASKPGTIMVTGWPAVPIAGARLAMHVPMVVIRTSAEPTYYGSTRISAITYKDEKLQATPMTKSMKHA